MKCYVFQPRCLFASLGLSLAVCATVFISTVANGRTGCQGNSTEDCCKHLVVLVPCTQCVTGGECCIQSQPSSGITTYITTGQIAGWNPADPFTSVTTNRCDYRVGVCTGNPPGGKPAVCDWPPPTIFNATCTVEFRQGDYTCNKVP
jgi:hypothetical protein